MGTEDTGAIASLRLELARAWQSERLVYRTVAADDDADVAFLQSVNSDPSNLALSGSGLLRPRTRAGAKALADVLSKTLLGVLICLPAATTPMARGDEVGGDARPPAVEEDGDEGRESARRGGGGQAPPHGDDTPIGFLCLGYGADEATSSPSSSHDRHVPLGIALAPAHQGRGYGPEALRWALGWAFRFANLHSVGLRVVEFNDRARRAYERVGFVREGRSREVVFCGGRYWDLLHYSILDREWEEGRGGV